MSLALPKRSRGYQGPAAIERYQDQLADWCRLILEINSTLDFKVSSRGWCYILEQKAGLLKGDFDDAQTLINDCRKNGSLPLDICAEDNGRAIEGLQRIDNASIDDEAKRALDVIQDWHYDYTPIPFWDTVDTYVEMATEKVDVKNLFASTCSNFYIPIFNAKGWADINSRAAMMKRFKRWEAKGKRIILLYCGDQDPNGLNISQFLRENLNDLSGAVGWSPDNLIIDRFSLNYDFIEAQGLTWIDNLETASGKRLDDPKHKDHFKPYVQNYLEQFGVRKIEANALVVRPEAGRHLCREAILRHVSQEAVDTYKKTLRERRQELRLEIARRFGGDE
jgi:hypothetical protein